MRMRRLALFRRHYSTNLHACTLFAPMRVYDTFVQHHAIALGNRTGGSARATAELEFQRNGVVQQVRSNSHKFHAGKAGRHDASRMSHRSKRELGRRILTVIPKKQS